MCQMNISVKIHTGLTKLPREKSIGHRAEGVGLKEDLYHAV